METLAIVRLAKNDLGCSESGHGVTLCVQLEELWIYETITGSILFKISPRNKIANNSKIDILSNPNLDKATTPKTNKEEIETVSVGSLFPYAVKQFTPFYPVPAKTAKITGVVVVELVVDEKGDVISAKCKSGHDMLKESALEAAKKWKFRPHNKNGKQSRMNGVISFNFSL